MYLVIRDDKFQKVLMKFLLAKSALSTDLRSGGLPCSLRSSLQHESWQLNGPTLLLVYAQEKIKVIPFDVGAEGRG